MIGFAVIAALGIGVPVPDLAYAVARRSDLWAEATEVARAARAAETATGWPAPLLLGLVEVESRYRANARSTAHCLGYAQLAPRTARAVARAHGVTGYRPDRARTALLVAAWYLRDMVATTGGWRSALTAYNVGPGAWIRGVRPRRYAHDVLAAYAGVLRDAGLALK